MLCTPTNSSPSTRVISKVGVTLPFVHRLIAAGHRNSIGDIAASRTPVPNRARDLCLYLYPLVVISFVGTFHPWDVCHWDHTYIRIKLDGSCRSHVAEFFALHSTFLQHHSNYSEAKHNRNPQGTNELMPRGRNCGRSSRMRYGTLTEKETERNTGKGR